MIEPIDAATADAARLRGEALTETLKPCPFCGERASVSMWSWGAGMVRCRGCGVSLTTARVEVAVDAWNTRVAPGA